MNAPKLFELSRQHYLPGYIRGRKQPAFIVDLKPSNFVIEALTNPATVQKLQRLLEAFQRHCDNKQPAIQPVVNDWPSLSLHIVNAASSVLNYLKFPILNQAEVLFAPEAKAWTQRPVQLVTAVPHCNPELCLKAIRMVLGMLTQAMVEANYELPRAKVDKVLMELKDALKGSVSALFLKAAYAAEIPVLTLHGATTQYGHGCCSHWFEHTFSLQSSNISVRLARDKIKSGLRLRQAGLPVPANTIVKGADEAIRFGQQVGFPVVIKPANLDGGAAVTANLSTPTEIRAAVQKVFKVANSVMVEKHVQGRDYRLTVLDGKVIWAVERVPGGVTGDGQHSIAELITAENNTEHRRVGPAQTLQPLSLNDEAKAQLAKQQLNANDVPAAGQFVRLSSIANVATGGRPVPVFEQVHPDNLQLAERAARALRLDIAGVDLLIPDITRSWREVGAAICEVNAQPDLGATTALHLYGQVLQARLPSDNGRIPIVAVVGTDAALAFIESCVSTKAISAQCGWVTSKALGIGGETLQTGNSKTFHAAQTLLTDPNVTGLLFQIHGNDILQTGLPVDHIDHAIIVEYLAPQPLHNEVVKTLRAACPTTLLELNANASNAEAMAAIKELLMR